MKKSIKVIIISIICILVIIMLCVLGYFIYIKNTYLSKEEIKQIVVRDTQLSAENITFKEIDLDLDDQIKKYDVEFYYNRVEYKYEIDAKNGNIIYSNYINNDNTTNNPTTETNNNSNTNTNNDSNYISPDEAKNIALADANLNINDVIFTDVDFETKNGQKIYEIDFYNNNLEYEYTIDAVNKNIINKNQEFRD